MKHRFNKIKDKLIITPTIQRHLALLKQSYNKNMHNHNIKSKWSYESTDKCYMSINDRIIYLRGKGLTVKQIAEELGITPKAVESRITRINKKKEEQMKQTPEEQIQIVIENFIHSLIDWTIELIKAEQIEDYDKCIAIRDIINSSVQYVAQDLVNMSLNTVTYENAFNRLDSQREYVYQNLREDDSE